MRQLLLFSLLLAAATTTAAPAIPDEMKGKQIQFSYSPSWKFTPLLIHFGKTIPGQPNNYTVHGENRSCNISYAPDTAAGKAILHVSGKKDKATIRMNFLTETAGIAHMRWNNADYFHLTFRLEDNPSEQASICRMGDPVGDIVPQSPAGKTLELDFSGAFDCSHNVDSTDEPSWQECEAAPLVIRFPQSDNSFTISDDDTASSLRGATVTYEPIACGACIYINKDKLNAEITLDFATSDTGTAYVTREEAGTTWIARGVRFRLSDTPTGNKHISTPSTPRVDDGLEELVQELKHKTYKTAVERLYQKRLLTILPQIMEGAPVDTIIPNANGTTALHNAGGLSHVEIVQWLINHGANLHAKTAKGAEVDDCVGGPNAKAIRTLLRQAATTR